MYDGMCMGERKALKGMIRSKYRFTSPEKDRRPDSGEMSDGLLPSFDKPLHPNPAGAPPHITPPLCPKVCKSILFGLYAYAAAYSELFMMNELRLSADHIWCSLTKPQKMEA